MVSLPESESSRNVRQFKDAHGAMSSDAVTILRKIRKIIKGLNTAKKAYGDYAAFLSNRGSAPPAPNALPPRPEPTGRFKVVKSAAGSVLRATNKAAKSTWVRLRGSKEDRVANDVMRKLSSVSKDLNRAIEYMNLLSLHLNFMKHLNNSLEDNSGKRDIISYIQRIEMLRENLNGVIRALVNKISNLLSGSDTLDAGDFDYALTAADGAIKIIGNIIIELENVEKASKAV